MTSDHQENPQQNRGFSKGGANRLQIFRLPVSSLILARFKTVEKVAAPIALPFKRVRATRRALSASQLTMQFSKRYFEKLGVLQHGLPYISG